jgi:hypothetical protein
MSVTLIFFLDKRKTELHGLYLKSFCHGFDKVLEGYRATLQRLEMEILADSDLTISHVCRSLFEVCRGSLIRGGLSTVLQLPTDLS